MGLQATTTSAGFQSGSAYVFLTTDDWNTYTDIKLTADDAALYDYFGGSVAVAGGTVVIGANSVFSSREAVYVFRTTDGGATYGQVVKLTASDAAAGDSFGRSVAIAGDTVMVGATHDDDACTAYYLCNSGSVYVFDPNTPTFQPTAQPTAQPTKQVDDDDSLAPWQIALISIAGLTFCVACFLCLWRMRKSRPSAKTSPTVPEIETPPMFRTTSVLPMGTVEAVQNPEDAAAAPPILGEVVTHSAVLSVSN